MKIITISREFGSGGRELGRRMAELTGFDYYDSEIIAQVAAGSGKDPQYVERMLGRSGAQSYSLRFGRRLSGQPAGRSDLVALLLEQRKVIEQIPALGRDCIIVGRDADILLAEYKPFTLFVCAQMDARIRRCRERAPQGEHYTDNELRRRIRQVDRGRSQTREILSGTEWGRRDAYHLTVNTTQWPIEALAPAVAAFAEKWFAAEGRAL